MAVKHLFTATAIAVMAGSAFGTDYLFPSANPPGGKSPSEVKQYISFIWDDNAYSGEVGSTYEIDYPKTKLSYVGGKGPNWDGQGGLASADGLGVPYPNKFNLNEGDLGISWAVKTLGGKMNGGHMTFNMIGGLFVDSWGPKWYTRESKYGSYIDGVAEGQPWKIAAINGREGKIGSTKGKQDVQRSYMNEGMKKLIAAGHEIGNHTLDHIETNSPYELTRPDGSPLWPNNGECFDDGTSGESALGEPWSEIEEFPSATEAELEMGWKWEAGFTLSKEGWTDVIKLGEEDGIEQRLYSKSDLYGFRAPRLEINSNMFYALKEQGYLYDCGVEEGMEESVDGTNFLWPYTTDNGIPNFYTQETLGEPVYADSLPAGLWEIPVNLMIVPEHLRQDVWAAHQEIEGATGDYTEWDGKITGFDFNMFVLFGMTKAQALETMTHTLDLHYNNNRAPMQIGCHTDYFSPMYDLATLAADPDAWGKALNYNTWTDRKETFEEFVDYANTLPDVEYVSGKELIDNIKDIIRGESIGSGTALHEGTDWYFLDDALKDEDGNIINEVSVNNLTGDITGNGFNGDITLGEENAATKQWVYASYVANVAENDLAGLTHISLDYKTNCPIALRVTMEGDNVYEDGEDQDYAAAWEVILNNKGPKVSSGPIPITAFKYKQYEAGILEKVDPAKIKSIEIAPLSKGKRCKFEISNIKTYGAATPISGDVVSNVKSGITVHSITNNMLKLNIPKAGQYSVELFTANGRKVRSISASQMSMGIKSIPMGNLSSGVYMLRVNGGNLAYSTKALVK